MHLLIECHTCYIVLHRGICTFGASFRLLLLYLSVCWNLSFGTGNASRTWYYLAFEHVKIVYEASFSSYGVICLLCLPLLAIWTSPKAKLSTVDCLEADRFEFYYRIAAQVQRNRVSKLWKLFRSWYACAVMNIVDTPSWIAVSTPWLASDCITKALHCDCCTEILYTCICSCCVCGIAVQELSCFLIV